MGFQMQPYICFFDVWKNEMAWCITHMQQVIEPLCNVDVWIGQEMICSKDLVARTLLWSDLMSPLRTLHLRRRCLGWSFELVFEQRFKLLWPESQGSHQHFGFGNTSTCSAPVISSIGCRFVWIARLEALQHDVSMSVVLVWTGECLLACAAKIPRFAQDAKCQRRWVAHVSRRICSKTSKQCFPVFKHYCGFLLSVPFFCMPPIAVMSSLLRFAWRCCWWRCCTCAAFSRSLGGRSIYVEFWQYVSRGSARHASVSYAPARTLLGIWSIIVWYWLATRHALCNCCIHCWVPLCL